MLLTLWFERQRSDKYYYALWQMTTAREHVKNVALKSRNQHLGCIDGEPNQLPTETDIMGASCRLIVSLKFPFSSHSGSEVITILIDTINTNMYHCLKQDTCWGLKPRWVLFDWTWNRIWMLSSKSWNKRGTDDKRNGLESASHYLGSSKWGIFSTMNTGSLDICVQMKLTDETVVEVK